MTNCIFYALFFALFLNVSIGSLKYSQVHRSFMAIYKGMLEACAITIDTNGEPIEPYFDKEKTAIYIANFLDKNVAKYVSDYNVSYEFINVNNSSFCSRECRSIFVEISAKINSFYFYKNSQNFSIVDGDLI